MSQQRIAQMHQAITELRMAGCWHLADIMEKLLIEMMDGQKPQRKVAA